ncbi:MAG: TfoX/Sxy family protein [bacterium]
MATTQQVADHILQSIHLPGDLFAKKMFGEYALYYNDKVVALICDNHLFIKITPNTEHHLDSSHHAPPYPGAKNHFKIPAEKLRDTPWLSNLIQETFNALPIPKPKKKKPTTPKPC